MKNQSLSIRNQHANLIINVSMIKNKICLLNIQNDVKYLKSYVNDSSRIRYLRFENLILEVKLLSKENIVKGLTSIYHLNQLCEGCCLLEKHP